MRFTIQMYKIIVNCIRFKANTLLYIMKKLLAFTLFIFFISCGKDTTYNQNNTFFVDQTINLNLPQYVGLQVAGNFAYIPAQGNSQGVIVQNKGTGSSPFVAWERTCPYLDCSNPMTFDGSLKMTCPCDNKDFSILNGSELPTASSKFAYEYRVTLLSPTTIRITNF